MDECEQRMIESKAKEIIVSSVNHSQTNVQVFIDVAVSSGDATVGAVGIRILVGELLVFMHLAKAIPEVVFVHVHHVVVTVESRQHRTLVLLHPFVLEILEVLLPVELPIDHVGDFVLDEEPRRLANGG